MFSVKISDKIYNGFIRASFTDSASTLCNKFNLECAIDENINEFPVKRGSPILILINEKQVSIAAVEDVNVNATSESFSLSVAGRDTAKSILKSSLKPSFNIVGPIGLIDLMKKCLKNVDLSFDIIDETDGIKEFTKKEIVNSNVGGNIWDLWLKMAQKRQVRIKQNRSGQIVVSQNGTKKYSKKLIRKRNDPKNENNIVSSRGKSSDIDRVKDIFITGKENLAVKRTDVPPQGNELYVVDLPSDVTAETAPNNERLDELNAALRASPKGSEEERAIDELIASEFANNIYTKNKNKKGGKLFKTTRNQTLGHVEDSLSIDGVYWEKADSPCSNDDCLELAKKKLNDLRVGSVSYSCEVSDFNGDDFEPWENGWLVDVIDEWCDVSATMFIQSVSFEYEITDDGNDVIQSCNLEMTIPDAYSANGGPSESEKRVTVIGEKFNLDDIIT